MSSINEKLFKNCELHYEHSRCKRTAMVWRSFSRPRARASGRRCLFLATEISFEFYFTFRWKSLWIQLDSCVSGWVFGHNQKFVLSISVYFELGLLEIKTENYLVNLLPDKFGYPIIRVRFRSWPNFVIVVVNTKLGEYLVKVLGQQFRSNLIFFQCMYSYQFARTNINSGII